ncbi:MAG TPA: thioredoxin domain-containing protein [Gemmatimonadales bacterium]|nr:thioredoxin domain-containing protein [Gemmatimonadales bacterium]
MRLALSLLAAVALATPLHAQDPMASRSKGRPTAPVTVYEMSDFQCPYCRRFALEIFPALDSAYIRTGKVRWVFVNFPLTQLHPNAAAAAQVAMCAARQDKFWPVHDLLFRNQPAWAPLASPAEYFLTFADSAALNQAAFQQCLSTGATRGEVEEDALAAARAGATSTPNFYIEGGIMAGAQPVSVFAPILDSIYAVKTAAPRKP